MRVGIWVVGGALLLATASMSRAEGVNCKQVNKYLQTGRSTKDVAETMVISEDDVKKCQDQAAHPAHSSSRPGGFILSIWTSSRVISSGVLFVAITFSSDCACRAFVR